MTKEKQIKFLKLLQFYFFRFLWFFICILFTLLTLYHQYLFYLFLFSNILSLAIPCILELSRLISIASYFLKKMKLALAIYIGVAVMSVAINIFQFNREIKEIDSKKLIEFGKIWQNLANQLVQKWENKIEENLFHRIQNVGILENNPENLTVKGKDELRKIWINDFEKKKITLFQNRPRNIAQYKEKILYLDSQIRREGTTSLLPDTIYTHNRESISIWLLTISNKSLYMGIMIFLTLLIELCIFLTGQRTFELIPKYSQKNPKKSKKNSKDLRKIYNEFLENKSCQNWLKAFGKNDVEKDKYGFPRPGQSGVKKEDRGTIIKKFREFLKEYPEFLKE